MIHYLLHLSITVKFSLYQDKYMYMLLLYSSYSIVSFVRSNNFCLCANGGFQNRGKEAVWGAAPPYQCKPVLHTMECPWQFESVAKDCSIDSSKWHFIMELAPSYHNTSVGMMLSLEKINHITFSWLLYVLLADSLDPKWLFTDVPKYTC